MDYGAKLGGPLVSSHPVDMNYFQLQIKRMADKITIVCKDWHFWWGFLKKLSIKCIRHSIKSDYENILSSHNPQVFLHFFLVLSFLHPFPLFFAFNFLHTFWGFWSMQEAFSSTIIWLFEVLVSIFSGVSLDKTFLVRMGFEVFFII